MLHRTSILVIIITVLLTGYQISIANPLLEAACQLDISSAQAALTTAQQAIDANDSNTALHAIGQARSDLQLQEAKCADYAPDDAGNSRTNPVPFGQQQHVEISRDFAGTVQLTQFLSGDDAQTYLKKANSRNESAPEGKQYLVYQMKYACDKTPDESCQFSKVYFDVVGDKGVTYDFTSPTDSGISIRNVGESAELFGGAEIDVDVAFVVDADDANFILMTAKSSKPRVFFASQ